MNLRTRTRSIATLAVVVLACTTAGCSEESQDTLKQKVDQAIEDLDAEGRLEEMGEKVGDAIEHASAEAREKIEEVADEADKRARKEINRQLDGVQEEVEDRASQEMKKARM